jgi:hypothetical protein
MTIYKLNNEELDGQDMWHNQGEHFYGASCGKDHVE